MDKEIILDKVQEAKNECRSVELLAELLNISVRFKQKGISEDIAIYCDMLIEETYQLKQRLNAIESTLS